MVFQLYGEQVRRAEMSPPRETNREKGSICTRHHAAPCCTMLHHTASGLSCIKLWIKLRWVHLSRDHLQGMQIRYSTTKTVWHRKKNQKTTSKTTSKTTPRSFQVCLLGKGIVAVLPKRLQEAASFRTPSENLLQHLQGDEKTEASQDQMASVDFGPVAFLDKGSPENPS